MYLFIRSAHLEAAYLEVSFFFSFVCPTQNLNPEWILVRVSFQQSVSSTFLQCQSDFGRLTPREPKKKGGPVFLSIGNLVTLFIKRFTPWGNIFPRRHSFIDFFPPDFFKITLSSIWFKTVSYIVIFNYIARSKLYNNNNLL